GLGAFYFGYESAMASPVRVGVLGTGDEGNVLIGAINPKYIEVKAIADVRPFSVHRAFHGDYGSSPELLKVRCGLMTKYGWSSEHEAKKHVTVYGRYEELLKNARKHGIEAVIIALPLHLHAPAAIKAMRAGLHVLTEKLMGHSVHQCKEMARVAKTTGKHLATGHQRHYNILYAEATEMIRRGLLGDLHYIRAQWHRGNLPGTDSWQVPLPKEAKPKDEQAGELLSTLSSWKQRLASAQGREIDVWRKKVAHIEAQIADKILCEIAEGKDKPRVEEYGYLAEKLEMVDGKTYDRPAFEELVRWRLFDRTGGGLMAELGSHQLDAASIFVSAVHGKKQHPLSVVAAANRTLFPRDRDANDHVYCILEFPAPGYDGNDPIAARKRIGVQYASINGNGFGGYGEIVYGTKGTLILEREKELQPFFEEKASKITAAQGSAMDTQASGPAQTAAATAQRDVSRGYTEQEEHWAWCIRNPAPENRPRCHPEVALGDAVIALTTNIAAKQGRRIQFDEEWFDIDSDATPEGEAPNVDREEYR
ncbi:MAG TPA: Gfo/Idh/MocA family oxidoreductase, partial [Thermoguttaceae bacterium]|nr:Gfo/Idh/MocA family oxidoreductase [Thermoguttaceae bacterium]HUT92872.1 Gfo/Idh/MocA family oxidoreductase [Thermoguttaceae bacterium]